jgi:hypothetical protein
MSDECVTSDLYSSRWRAPAAARAPPHAPRRGARAAGNDSGAPPAGNDSPETSGGDDSTPASAAVHVWGQTLLRAYSWS